MQRYAFKMFLNPGESHEYRRRHDAIWPELQALLRESGVRNYSIFLDPDTYILAPLEASYLATWESCPEEFREAIPESNR